MIKFFHIYKRYSHNITALNDLSCSIDAGDFVFLTGRSGAGKTTFLRLVIKDEKPTAGNILINNKNITRLKSNSIALLRRRIGVVFQDFKLIKYWTIKENVEFPLRILGVPRAKRAEKVMEVLKMLKIEQYAEHYPNQVSGGEQQRAAIARAVVNDPLIILADEPTGNLDPEISFDIIKMFKSINAKGTTIVIATHDASLLKAFPSKIMRLEGGRVVND